jgi:hypothetical protein
MTESISKLRRALLAGAAALLLLGACAAPGQDPQVNVDGPAPSAAKTPEAANPPAVTEATITVPPKTDGGEQGEQAASAGDVSTWKQVTRTAGDVTYSHRYPPGWTADLSYCAPGAARTMTGGELPPRCASTDILVGQKAADVATIQGENISLNGKQAVKQINKEPRNGMASRIYTVVIYDAAGGPLMGFSTSIGPGTDEATQNNITAMLDQVAGTLTVGR